MPFSVEDFQDLVRLLEQRPDWQAQLRRLVLSEELLGLPALVRELAAAQARTEARVEELAAAQARTEARVEELAAAQARTEARVAELAVAQARTEARLDRVEAALQRLAEAQARTEVRVAELAAAQARTEARVEELAAAQARTEARLDRVEAALQRLAEAQARTEARLDQLAARMDGLAEAQRQIEVRVAELAAAQARTERELAQLTIRVDRLTEQIESLAEAQRRTDQRVSDLRGEFRGYFLEWRYRERASAYFGPLLRHLRVHSPSAVVDQYEAALPSGARLDLLKADLIVQGHIRAAVEPEEVWLVVEISATIDRSDLERAVQRARALREAGLRALPAVAGDRATPTVERRAREEGVVVFRDGSIEGWEEALAVWAKP